MANAAIAWRNLALAGTLTASSAAALLPVTRLQNEHVSKRWRSTANTASFDLNLGSNQPLDLVALFGLTMGAAGTIGCKVSTSAAGPAAGNLLDTGALAYGGAYFDYRYGAFVYPLPAPVSGRYVRFDLADSAAAYVEAGLLFVALRTGLTYNFSQSAERTRRDLSRRSETPSGQVLIDRKPQKRSFNLPFDMVTAAEWAAALEVMEMEAGTHSNMIVILDTASDNIPRDTICGLLKDLNPVRFTPVEDFLAVQYAIEERL